MQFGVSSEDLWEKEKSVPQWPFLLLAAIELPGDAQLQPAHCLEPAWQQRGLLLPWEEVLSPHSRTQPLQNGPCGRESVRPSGGQLEVTGVCCSLAHCPPPFCATQSPSLWQQA